MALYGTLDNDDMFMYMGGLATAIRGLDGKTPELLITDSRDPGNPAMTSLDKFVGREFRSRYVNPTWIKGMQKEGYAGAGAMREFVEYLWGWDATATDVVDDAMWQETFATYVEDKNDLGMKAFFEEKSPFAYQDITARMIETIRKDYWQADGATRDRLISEYVESVATHGANCTDISCGNGRLLRYVMEQAVKSGVPAPTLAKARAALEKAMGRTIETAAAQLEEFARRNDAREVAEQAQARRTAASVPRSSTPPAPVAAAMRNRTAPRAPDAASERRPAETDAPAQPDALTGRIMTEQDRTPTVSPPERRDRPALSLFDALWPAGLFLCLLLGWRWRSASPARL